MGLQLLSLIFRRNCAGELAPPSLLPILLCFLACLLPRWLAGWLAGKLAAKSFYSACLHRSHPSPPPSHELLGGYIIAMIQQSVTAFATKTTRKKEQLQQLVPPRKKKNPNQKQQHIDPPGTRDLFVIPLFPSSSASSKLLDLQVLDPRAGIRLCSF